MKLAAMTFATLCTLSLVTLCLLIGSACSTTTAHGDQGSALTLVEPADQTLKQGETNRVAVAVTRDNFSGPVAVRFENLPRGVSVVEKDPTIPAGDNLVNFTLHAAADAAVVKNHRVLVRASGPEGMVATEAFEVTVKVK